jgi:hypothetical protein
MRGLGWIFKVVASNVQTVPNTLMEICDCKLLCKTLYYGTQWVWILPEWLNFNFLILCSCTIPLEFYGIQSHSTHVNTKSRSNQKIVAREWSISDFDASTLFTISYSTLSAQKKITGHIYWTETWPHTHFEFLVQCAHAREEGKGVWHNPLRLRSIFRLHQKHTDIDAFSIVVYMHARAHAGWDWGTTQIGLLQPYSREVQWH